MADFLKNHLEIVAGEITRGQVLFNLYKGYCQQNKTIPKTYKDFRANICSLDPSVECIKYKNRIVFKNIRLRNDNEELKNLTQLFYGGV